jgi:hypothetical protein
MARAPQGNERSTLLEDVTNLVFIHMVLRLENFKDVDRLYKIDRGLGVRSVAYPVTGFYFPESGAHKRPKLPIAFFFLKKKLN